nr:hypothetical protein GCM10017611_03060 [Rhodococcus wratislaviensis]
MPKAAGGNCCGASGPDRAGKDAAHIGGSGIGPSLHVLKEEPSRQLVPADYVAIASARRQWSR